MRMFLPLLAVAFLCVNPTFAADPVGLDLGADLPAFKLAGVDDKTYTEKDFADAKILLLVFTCNHCPTAQAYEDRIIKLEADYRDKGVKLIAISPNADSAVRLDELGYSEFNDSLPEMKLRAKHRGFKFPYLYDGETQAFSRQVGVKATPQVFIFDGARKLRYIGRIDNAEIGEVTTHDTRNALDDLLAGREVKTAKTRSFGCSTKWSEKIDGVKEADEKWAKLEVTLAKADLDAVKKIAANDSDNFVLVNLWATWCGPCVREFPDLVTMQRMFGKRHFKMVTISFDSPDDEAKTLKFLKEKQAAQMTNLLWQGGDKDKLAEALDAKWDGPIPHTILIAPGGKIVYRKAGPFDAVEVKRAIVDQLGRTYASKKK